MKHVPAQVIIICGIIAGKPIWKQYKAHRAWGDIAKIAEGESWIKAKTCSGCRYDRPFGSNANRPCTEPGAGCSGKPANYWKYRAAPCAGARSLGAEGSGSQPRCAFDIHSSSGRHTFEHKQKNLWDSKQVARNIFRKSRQACDRIFPQTRAGFKNPAQVASCIFKRQFYFGTWII